MNLQRFRECRHVGAVEKLYEFFDRRLLEIANVVVSQRVGKKSFFDRIVLVSRFFWIARFAADATFCLPAF